MRKEKIKIGILTSPIEIAGIPPLSNLITIVSGISDNICLITGNTGFDFFKKNTSLVIFNASLSRSNNIFLRILKYISLQVKLSLLLYKTRKLTDIWIFMFGAESQILPLLFLKLMRKKAILYFTGSSLETQKQQRDLFLPVLQVIYYVSCTLADSLIVYSERNVKEYGLVKWTNKISFFQEHLIDTELFCIKKNYKKRDNIIGYIGRFSEEKGIINFVESIPLLKRNLPEYSFFIGGEGPLRNDIENKLNLLEMKNINFIGWIDHQRLAEYLNELNLLVLPSFTEGLPNIMLEAFACGTPVLATPVGAIPDIIIDGKTGFLMENNTPECIKNNVVRALNNHDTNQIISNAKSYVLKNFEFEKKVEDLGNILKKINSSK